MTTSHELDELFGEMAERCRAFLLAWTAAKPTPSLTSERAHDRLMEAHNALERTVVEIARIFNGMAVR